MGWRFHLHTYGLMLQPFGERWDGREPGTRVLFPLQGVC